MLRCPSVHNSIDVIITQIYMSHHMARTFRSSTACAKMPDKYVVTWLTTCVAIVALLGYLLSVVPRFQDVDTEQSHSQDWLQIQETVSLDAIFANFGSAGAKAYGATEGVLLDSSLPSPHDCK